VKRILHILSAKEFTEEFRESFLADVEEMEKLRGDPSKRKGLLGFLKDVIIVLFFYEESTRTRISFEIAAHNLGARVISAVNAGIFSSVKKGETFYDTIRTLIGYIPRFIILRHKVKGSAAQAARIVDESGRNVSIINAGDGTGEHPTQALLDWWTIYKEKGRVEDLVVAVGGDLLHGRTTHSLVYLLSKYKGVSFIFIAPDNLQMKKDLCDYLDVKGVEYEKTSDKRKIKEADVVYWTRTQKERMNTNKIYTWVRDLIYRLFCYVDTRYVITAEDADSMKEDAIIMHPFPRVGEITRAVDKNKRARYFQQSENGVLVRMVILCNLYGVKIRK